MAKAPQVLERDFQTTVVELAKMCGWRVHHSRPALDSHGRWRTPVEGDKGWPDLALAHPRGRFILAELKSATGRTSPEQQAWITALRCAGVTVHVWRPVDMPVIQAALEAMA